MTDVRPGDAWCIPGHDATVAVIRRVGERMWLVAESGTGARRIIHENALRRHYTVRCSGYDFSLALLP